MAVLESDVSVFKCGVPVLENSTTTGASVLEYGMPVLPSLIPKFRFRNKCNAIFVAEIYQN